jgi:hypothetical protein
MRTIYKYPLEITGEQKIQMPEGARLRHVGLDTTDTPCVWAEVETNNPTWPVTIYLSGTGRPLHNYARNYVGSFVERSLVWHIYT